MAHLHVLCLLSNCKSVATSALTGRWRREPQYGVLIQRHLLRRGVFGLRPVQLTQGESVLSWLGTQAMRPKCASFDVVGALGVHNELSTQRTSEPPTFK